MFNELIAKLNDLEENFDCTKKFFCTKESLKDSCHARYQAMADLMKCVDDQQKACEFYIPFGGDVVCMCPLRKLIALNFEELNKNDNPKLTQ